MIEKRDSDTGAILFKKSHNEMRLDRLEEEIKDICDTLKDVTELVRQLALINGIELGQPAESANKQENFKKQAGI